ncbi:MAG TPA: lipopolysaccharide heptosyltransferase II [Lacipirellulaceae bacterium]|jgi:heptosyltransferase-2
MRLGIFLPNWIGDVVMATPALRALRNHFGPEAHLVGIMRPYVAAALEGTPWLSEALFYEKSYGLSERGWWRVVARLRAAKLDKILLLTNSTRTGLMARLSGAGERIGMTGEGRSWLLSNPVTQPIDTRSGLPIATIDAYIHLAAAVGCPPESPRLELGTTAADERASDRVWQRLRLPSGDRVVVLNTGGAFGSAKNWPLEHFAELARRIAIDYGLAVLVNCGPNERDEAQSVVKQANDARVTSLADEPSLPLGLTKACIRRARMLVTTDSGPRYFGIAFGKPVITLFGPTDPRMTETHYDRETVVSLSLECQPCMERTCPLVHHRCMRDLSVDVVRRAVARQLDAKPTEQAA